VSKGFHVTPPFYVPPPTSTFTSTALFVRSTFNPSSEFVSEPLVGSASIPKDGIVYTPSPGPSAAFSRSNAMSISLSVRRSSLSEIVSVFERPAVRDSERFHQSVLQSDSEWLLASTDSLPKSGLASSAVFTPQHIPTLPQTRTAFPPVASDPGPTPDRTDDGSSQDDAQFPVLVVAITAAAFLVIAIVAIILLVRACHGAGYTYETAEPEEPSGEKPIEIDTVDGPLTFFHPDADDDGDVTITGVTFGAAEDETNIRTERVEADGNAAGS
jgi:hypothetical protein